MTSRRMPFELLISVGIAAWLWACSGQPARPPKLTDEMYAWTLRTPQALGADFLWQQRLTARFGPRSESIKVAVQKVADRLTIVGLTPFATKAFVLEQQGDAVTFKKMIDRDMPFPPRFVLVDLQRAYLPLGPPHPADGESQEVLDGERVTQLFAKGQLIERRFARLDSQPRGEIVIRYSQYRDDGLPGRIVLDNKWFGYQLEVATLSAARPEDLHR